MRVGISIQSDSGRNVVNSDPLQAIYNLAHLMRKIAFVEDVFLLNCDDSEGYPDGVREFASGFALAKPGEVVDNLDIVINTGANIDMEWIRRFWARGGKIAYHVGSQPYAALVEKTMFDRDDTFVEPERCDEVWLTPDSRQFRAMVEAIYRCPTYEVPYLWSARFLEETIRQASESESSFGYVAGQLTAGELRPAIFEPNLSPTAMALIPLLICEEVQRQRPGSVTSVDLVNGEHMCSQLSFIFFMRNLHIYNSERVRIHGFDCIANVMTRTANLVVSHQIERPQANLYFEALHGTYPLVHNSQFFSDVGYYYHQSDVQAGASAMFQALRNHDLDLVDYSRKARAKINQASPEASANIDWYARRLILLSHRQQTGRPI